MITGTSETLPVIDHLSYSSVNTYRQCPLKWHFRYVEKIPEEVIGSVIVGQLLGNVLVVFQRDWIILATCSSPCNLLVWSAVHRMNCEVLEMCLFVKCNRLLGTLTSEFIA